MNTSLLTGAFWVLFSVALFGQGRGFLEDYLRKWENGAAYTIEFAEALPESLYDYRPVPEEMQFREQIVHICGNIKWLTNAYLGGAEEGPDVTDPPRSKEGLIRLLRSSFDYAADAIRSFDATHLDQEVDFFAGPITKRQVFFLMSDHVTHHRGQLVVYLRLNQINPPDYRGW